MLPRLREAAHYLRIPIPWQWSTASATQNSTLWQRQDTVGIPECSAVPRPRQYCLVSILPPAASGSRGRRSLRVETASIAGKPELTTGSPFAKPIVHEKTLPSHCLSHSHSHRRCLHDEFSGLLHRCAQQENSIPTPSESCGPLPHWFLPAAAQSALSHSASSPRPPRRLQDGRRAECLQRC